MGKGARNKAMRKEIYEDINQRTPSYKTILHKTREPVRDKYGNLVKNEKGHLVFRTVIKKQKVVQGLRANYKRAKRLHGVV